MIKREEISRLKKILSSNILENDVHVEMIRKGKEERKRIFSVSDCYWYEKNGKEIFGEEWKIYEAIREFWEKFKETREIEACWELYRKLFKLVDENYYVFPERYFLRIWTQDNNKQKWEIIVGRDEII